jgi:hypothetical protein
MYIIIIPRYNIINNGGAHYCNVGTDVYIIIRRNYPSQCDGGTVEGRVGRLGLLFYSVMNPQNFLIKRPSKSNETAAVATESSET